MSERLSPLVTRVASASVLAMLALTGCSAAEEDAEDAPGAPGVALSEITNGNALNPNALNPNALNPNALNPNALSPRALAAITNAGTAGDLSRQLLRYTVSCALDTTQSFNFSWTDSQGAVHGETYPGLIGLQPGWATQPLAAIDGQWISACLASRINWYGVPVTLSSRGAHPKLRSPTSLEISNYAHQEGAFWGDLFSASPSLYACSYDPDDSYSRSKMRDCAAGHLDSQGVLQSCGMVQLVGSCDTHCDALQGTARYHAQCATTVGGAPVGQIVSTYLQ